MQVSFTHPHAAVTFGNDPTIFSPTNPTYRKVTYSESLQSRLLTSGFSCSLWQPSALVERSRQLRPSVRLRSFPSDNLCNEAARAEVVCPSFGKTNIKDASIGQLLDLFYFARVRIVEKNLLPTEGRNLLSTCEVASKN